ncbi:MAG: glycine cleavage system protein GcvH [Deltaproteobacteria bacterium]
MKEINELQFPGGFLYAKDHEWAKPEGDKVRVGISDYAQDQLGDIVFVELPQVGSRHVKGTQFGTVESVKAVSELYMPVGGEVLSVNKTLEDAPEILNKEPYGLGWLIEIKLEDHAELKSLMDRDAYLDFLKGLSR